MPRKRRVTSVGSDGPLRVLGYIRVSTDEQATSGLSLINQQRRIEDYCKLYNLDLVRVKHDAGASGKNLNREGMAAVLGELEQRSIDGVIAMKLDRLTRSLRDCAELIERFFTEKAGLQLFTVDEKIDTCTSGGRLVINVIMSVNQWEREIIAERTKNALQGKIARGERCGRVRFGYTLADDGKTLVPDPEEQKAIALLRQWDEDGKKYREMIEMLEEMGIDCKEPGSIWYPGTIRRILTRPIP